MREADAPVAARVAHDAQPAAPVDAVKRLGLAAAGPKATEDYWSSLGGGNKMRS